MNNERRKTIETIEGLLNEALELAQQVEGEEQEAFDNMPESFQQTERGEKSEESISNLQDAASEIEAAISSIDSARGE